MRMGAVTLRKNYTVNVWYAINVWNEKYTLFFGERYLLLFVLIFATPQGAIRRQLQIQEEVSEAITSTIEKNIVNSKPMSEYYSVMINDTEKNGE